VRRLLGSHPADAGGIHVAARRAGAAGMTTLQLFTAPPTYYGDKAGMRTEKAAKFHAALEACGIRPGDVLVHAAYVLNTASPEEEKAVRARAGLTKELERTQAIGALGCCFHPGSAGTGDPERAAIQVGETIRHAVQSVPGTARVLVENTAGAGKTMGRTPKEIALMLAQVPSELRHRTGYGLDTCHLFAAGHDIASGADAQRAVLDRFEQVIGEPPAFFHLNDSQYPFASNKDRHALLGEGAIGAPPFQWLLADPRALSVPCILETPHDRDEVDDGDVSADPADLRMMELLRAWTGG
jgi:deoxyribonuclease-4